MGISSAKQHYHLTFDSTLKTSEPGDLQQRGEFHYENKAVRASTLVPRILSVVLRVLLFIFVYLPASLFAKNKEIAPNRITDSRTPVLLIHGSAACQRQWDVFAAVLIKWS